MVATGVKTIFMIIRNSYTGTITFPETRKTHLPRYIDLSGNQEDTSTPVHQPFQKPGRHIYPKTLRSPFSSLRNKHQFLSHAKTQRDAKMKKSKQGGGDVNLRWQT